MADASRRPVVFGPTVHVDLLEHGPSEERFRIWAFAKGAVASWSSRRQFDAENLTVGFRQGAQCPAHRVDGRTLGVPGPRHGRGRRAPYPGPLPPRLHPRRGHPGNPAADHGDPRPEQHRGAASPEERRRTGRSGGRVGASPSRRRSSTTGGRSPRTACARLRGLAGAAAARREPSRSPRRCRACSTWRWRRGPPTVRRTAPRRSGCAASANGSSTSRPSCRRCSSGTAGAGTSPRPPTAAAPSPPGTW
ncbi:hypothetical protein LT493_02290 [Streptomyces tricolor]|nr:hypothetical protein [Streptomyces tricolor]